MDQVVHGGSEVVEIQCFKSFWFRILLAFESFWFRILLAFESFWIRILLVRILLGAIPTVRELNESHARETAQLREDLAKAVCVVACSTCGM